MAERGPKNIDFKPLSVFIGFVLHAHTCFWVVIFFFSGLFPKCRRLNAVGSLLFVVGGFSGVRYPWVGLGQQVGTARKCQAPPSREEVSSCFGAALVLHLELSGDGGPGPRFILGVCVPCTSRQVPLGNAW